jgi:hypothetical protein
MAAVGGRESPCGKKVLAAASTTTNVNSVNSCSCSFLVIPGVNGAAE